MFFDYFKKLSNFFYITHFYKAYLYGNYNLVLMEPISNFYQFNIHSFTWQSLEGILRVKIGLDVLTKTLIPSL